MCLAVEVCTECKKRLQIPQCNEGLHIFVRRDMSGCLSPWSSLYRYSRSGTALLIRSSVQCNSPFLFLSAKFNCKKHRARGDGRRAPGVECGLRVQTQFAKMVQSQSSKHSQRCALKSGFAETATLSFKFLAAKLTFNVDALLAPEAASIRAGSADGC